MTRRRDSVLLGVHGSPAELLDPVRGIAGAAELRLEQDVFVEHFGNDLPSNSARRLWAGQRSTSTREFAMARCAGSHTTLAGGSRPALTSHPDAAIAVTTSAIVAMQ